MKILVTGGAGCIGSYLCAWLLERGHSVTAYDNLSLGKLEYLAPLKKNKKFKFIKKDLLKDKTLDKTVKGHDLVFHLAANSDISLGRKKTDLDLNQNAVATYKVLEAMRKTKVNKIIFASTSAIYGEASLKPTPEQYGPLIPISFYGASKLSAEGLIAAFAHNYGIKSWIYRFANIVGPNLTHGVIYDFVAKLKKSPKTLQVLGNGTQKKSYLHVQDCVEGMWFGFEKAQDEVNLFNLASEGVTQVKVIAEEVLRQLKSSANIQYGTEDRGWKGDVPFTWLDGSKLNQLGWKAYRNSDEAVRQAISETVKAAK